MTIMSTRLRHRDILDAQLAGCRQVDNSFTWGAVAGLRWLTVGVPRPLTGALASGGLSAALDFGPYWRFRPQTPAVIEPTDARVGRTRPAGRGRGPIVCTGFGVTADHSQLPRPQERRLTL